MSVPPPSPTPTPTPSNPYIRGYGSVYRVQPDATPDERIYGSFPDCRILGTACTIHAAPAGDRSDMCRDILGVPAAFARGETAIHVSGKDPFGHETGPGFIRAIAHYRVAWPPGVTEHPAGLGCYKSERACIVTWDGHRERGSHRDESWAHHALYGGCDGYFTLRGILEWWRDLPTEHATFTPADVCRAANRARGYDSSSCMSLDEPQHRRAVRRLLETGLAPRYREQLGAQLVRSGRWAYRWEE